MEINGTMRLLVWNLEWARPNTTKGRIIQSLLDEWKPDVAVLTETAGGWFGGSGHTALSAAGYGYRAEPWKRKAIL